MVAMVYDNGRFKCFDKPKVVVTDTDGSKSRQEALRLSLNRLVGKQSNTSSGRQHNAVYVEAVELLLRILDDDGYHELTDIFRRLKDPVGSEGEYDSLCE